MAKIIFSYRVKYDEGKAPCVDDGLLTLACCKSDLRRIIAKEQKNHPENEYWLLGLCAGNGLRNNILFYAKLLKPMLADEYYTEYTNRNDSFYQVGSEGLLERNRRFACIHAWDDQGAKEEDIERQSAQYVLRSDNFWYFGDNPVQIKDEVSKQFAGLLATYRCHRPARPYEANDDYESLHENIMRLLDGKPKSGEGATAHLPLPIKSGCCAKEYAWLYTKAEGYKQAKTIQKHVNDENRLPRMLRYCKECDDCLPIEGAE